MSRVCLFVCAVTNNGCEIAAGVDDQEQTILRLAAGSLEREELTAWVQAHLQKQMA